MACPNRPLSVGSCTSRAIGGYAQSLCWCSAIAADPARFQERIEGEGAARKIVHDLGYVYPLFAEFHQAEAKLDSMNRKGIDISVISPAPPMFYYLSQGPQGGQRQHEILAAGSAETDLFRQPGVRTAGAALTDRPCRC
jgi:hypothetical protein